MKKRKSSVFKRRHPIAYGVTQMLISAFGKVVEVASHKLSLLLAVVLAGGIGGINGISSWEHGSKIDTIQTSDNQRHAVFSAMTNMVAQDHAILLDLSNRLVYIEQSQRTKGKR